MRVQRVGAGGWIMKTIAAIIGTLTQLFIAALLLALTACGDDGGARRADYGIGYGIGYGGSGPVYTLGGGLPAYRLEPRTYWNYPDYSGTGPMIELASRPSDRPRNLMLRKIRLKGPARPFT